MAKKSSTLSGISLGETDTVRLVNVQNVINSHIIGLNKAISQLATEDERLRARKEVAGLISSGSLPLTDWLVGG